MEKITQKKWFFLILWGLFYFFIFTLLLRGSFSYLDPDLGWHLKVGEEIAQTWSVPDTNHYNYTFTGNWVDHEWLSNLAVYEIYSHFGYIALSVLFALLIVAVLVILNIWARRVYPESSPYLIIFLQLLGVVAASPHFGVRMQESGLLFLALTLLIIFFYNKSRNWRRLLILAPLMYLWACLHASFLIGLAILFFLFGVKVLEKIISRYFKRDWLDYSNIWNWREIAVFFATALGAVAATLFTPYRLKLYSFLAGYKDNFYQSHIQEWLPQFYYPFNYSQLLYLALAAAAVFFYIYYSQGKKRHWRLDMWTLGLATVFIFLSFKAHRHFPLMFVATFIFLISIFSGLFKLPQQTGNPRQLSWSNWLKGYVLVCLFLVAGLQLLVVNFTAVPFSLFKREYPVGAARFLQENPQYDSLKLFNSYNWGGFLIWALPRRSLFIDGRLPQVSYQGQTFLEEYFDFFQKEADISRKLDDYNIDLILLPVKDEEVYAKRWEQFLFGISNKNLLSHNYLRDYLNSSGDWQSLYYDRTAIIYSRVK
jgi:hypothetical protein